MRYLLSSISLSASWLAGALALASVGCGSAESPSPAATAPSTPTTPQTASKAADPSDAALPALPMDSEFVQAETPVVDRTPSARPQVALHTSHGVVTIELFREEAPQTVRNFLETYVENGLYTHTVFHHVDAGFIAIAGGYDGDLRPVYAGEPIPNESSPRLKNVKGTVAMVRLPDNADSATSQFFFNLSDNPDFDAASNGEGYCVFGRVIEGIEVLDRIAAAPTTAMQEFPKIPSDLAKIETVGVLRY